MAGRLGNPEITDWNCRDADRRQDVNYSSSPQHRAKYHNNPNQQENVTAVVGHVQQLVVELLNTSERFIGRANKKD